MKMEQTDCSGMSAYKVQTPGNYPEESVQKIPSILYHEDGGSRFLSNAANTNKTTHYHNPKDLTLNITYAFDLLSCFCETQPLSHINRIHPVVWKSLSLL